MNPIRINGKPDIERIKIVLAEFYSSKPQVYGFFHSRAEEYGKYADFINKYVPDCKSKILDLGCGDWQIPTYVGKKGYAEVVGCDFFSETSFNEYSSKISIPNARLVKYDGFNIPFPDKYFDCISSLCVLEHIPNVEELLNQMDRVLKLGGIFIIKCPNWSGINNPVRALQKIAKNQRYWQYDSVLNSIVGFFRSIGWYLENLLSLYPKWILVYPRMKDGKINFELSDDDVVHLCQPLSIKKYFLKRGYKLLLYNRGYGESKFARIFNTVFPSFATTINIVAQKQ